MNKAENRVFLIKFVGLFFNIKDVLKALKKKRIVKHGIFTNIKSST